MGWTKVGQVLHDCPKPTRREIRRAGFPIGSEWTCDGCGQVWEYCYPYGEDRLVLDRSGPYVLIDPDPMPPLDKEER